MLFRVVIEAYDHMLKGYEGLQRPRRSGSNAALGVAALSVPVMVVAGRPADGADSHWGIFWMRQERSVYLALTAICLLPVSVGACYGWAVSRNAAAVLAVCGLFSLSQAGLLVFRDHLGAEFRTISPERVPTLYVVWVLAGAFAFTRMGEERPTEETEPHGVMHQARQDNQPGSWRA